MTFEDLLVWNGITVAESMVLTGLAKTKSEARRMIHQGSVKVDDIKVTNPKAVILFSPDRTKHCVVH
jgi:tyrosyl-tRNA synthetase